MRPSLQDFPVLAAWKDSGTVEVNLYLLFSRAGEIKFSFGWMNEALTSLRFFAFEDFSNSEFSGSQIGS